MRIKNYITQSTLLTLLFTGAILFTLSSCRKVAVGYLITESAGYEIDSMVVKAELDITPPLITQNPLYDMYIGFGFPPDLIFEMGIYPTLEIGGGADYTRNKLGQPWTSTSIEGVLGTPPIILSVKEITSPNGDPEKLKQVIAVRANGILSIPLNHGVPPGIYIISLNFKNEGYSKDKDDVFRIIVK
jgi:hypothetical protein